MSDSINNAIDVAYQTEVSIEYKTTEQLTAEINTEYRQAEQLAGMSAMMLAEAGRRLIEVKNRLPHGEFMDWCGEHLEFSYRKASKMMQLAKKMEDENSIFSKMPTSATIEISTVLELLAAPEEIAAEVIETTEVESLTIKELRAEIARVKEEKATAERRLEMAESVSNNLRADYAGMERKLSEAVSETELAEMQKAAQKKESDLRTEINTLTAANRAAAQKIEETKENLKKAKQKLKDAEAAKDEEVQKRLAVAAAELEEKHADDIKKAKEEGAADAAASLGQMSNEIRRLEAEIEKLEADKAKLSNTNLMEFKVLCDELQDILEKASNIIDDQNDKDPEIGGKMIAALKQIGERWIP